jgi:ABC-type glycerol-3-phosphate transport system substrate-binding protein
VLALAVAALVAACGGGDDNQAATTTVDESPASTTTNQEPEQDAGAWMKELTERSLRGQYGRNCTRRQT